jgi:hypothetical protein
MDGLVLVKRGADVRPDFNWMASPARSEQNVDAWNLDESPACARSWTLIVAGHMLADNFHFVFRLHFVEKP